MALNMLDASIENDKKTPSEHRADKYVFTASKEEAEVASKRTIKPVHTQKHGG